MSEPSSTRRGPVRGFLRTGTNRRGRNPRPGTWLIRAGASRFDPWLVVAILSLAVAILLAARVRAAAPRVVSIPPEAFVDADGVAWGVSLAPLLDGLRLPFPLEVGPTDDLAHATVSPHRLLEDGAPLSPAHSLHAEIFERGAGRHSFWVDSLLMSTSDNSDPRANGRTYQIELGVRARPWAILLGAGLALMPALWLLRHVRGRVLARLAAWCACIGSFALVAAILARPAWARCVEHLPPAILCVAFLGAASAGTAAVLLRIADRWRDRASPRPASLATRTAVAVARSATRTRRVFFCACAGRWRLGLATAMALAVASLLRWWAPLPPPVSQWPGVRYLAVAQGRIVDSDALEHWASSQWLRWQGELPRFAARRPLCATLMAAESSLGDGRMQVVLLLNTLLCGAAIWFVARAAGRSLGVWAGLATYAVLLGYAQHFLGLPMTESLGLSLGALGTGLLLRGVETRRPPIWSLGCFALSLGLFARAGAFFVLPAIVLALAWTARRSGRRAWIAPVAAAALAASSMTAAFVLNATVFRLTSDGGSTPNSNFAFVAFGLASGGTWTLGQEWIVQHMPMSTEAQQEAALYEETWKRIEADPTVLARSLHSALGAFVAAWGPGVAAHFGDRGLLAAALPSRWSAWLPANAPAHAIWSILGPLTLLLRLRRVGRGRDPARRRGARHRRLDAGHLPDGGSRGCADDAAHDLRRLLLPGRLDRPAPQGDGRARPGERRGRARWHHPTLHKSRWRRSRGRAPRARRAPRDPGLGPRTDRTADASGHGSAIGLAGIGFARQRARGDALRRRHRAQSVVSLVRSGAHGARGSVARDRRLRPALPHRRHGASPLQRGERARGAAAIGHHHATAGIRAVHAHRAGTGAAQRDGSAPPRRTLRVPRHPPRRDRVLRPVLPHGTAHAAALGHSAAITAPMINPYAMPSITFITVERPCWNQTPFGMNANE
ncbi:MAG: hypothetical protein U0575_04975 [Phycisphaerales bacterium]